MDINALLDKVAEDFAAKALARYDAFLVANAKPLTMVERVKGTVRPTPISFEAYLELCFAATKATPARCSFVARPRVRAWRSLKHGGDDDMIDPRYINDCPVCFKPTFGSRLCMTCHGEHKKGPRAFIKKHGLCKHCFNPKADWGCLVMCDGAKADEREADWREMEDNPYPERVGTGIWWYA